MSALDKIRSFAEARSGDSVPIRDGLTYADARELLCDVTAARAEVERLRGALASALATAKWLFDEGYFNDGHMDDCPEDDTCECEWVLRINLLFNLLSGVRS